jgi:hypothetical protein
MDAAGKYAEAKADLQTDKGTDYSTPKLLFRNCCSCLTKEFGG